MAARSCSMMALSESAAPESIFMLQKLPVLENLRPQRLGRALQLDQIDGQFHDAFEIKNHAEIDLFRQALDCEVRVRARVRLAAFRQRTEEPDRPRPVRREVRGGAAREVERA